MTASLSDATSTVFVGCKASDTLADASHQYGYLITVSLSFWDSVVGLSWFMVSLEDLVHDLWVNLQAISGDALAVQSPEPAVEPAYFDTGVHATLSARTLGNAAHLTCGELVTRIGQFTPLAVVQVKRVSVDAVRGADRVQVRADADAEADAAAKDNSLPGAINNALKAIGVTVGIALVIALLIVGVVYFKRK